MTTDIVAQPSALVSPAPARALDAAGDVREIAFTIVANSNGPLTKGFAVGADGAPMKVKEPGLSRGSASRVTLTGSAGEMAEQLAKILRGLPQNKALILAPPPPGKETWPLVLLEEVRGRSDAIARTKESFVHSAGPAILGLDFDVKGYPPEIVTRLGEVGAISGALASVFPDFAQAAAVLRASASAGIRNRRTGKATPKEAGQHRYLFVLDGADVGEFARRLSDRLMLAGWLWGEVSASGRLLYRTLLDTGSSADPSRLFYEADADLSASKDLEHVPDVRTPKVRPGGFLDTRALAPLTDQERAQLDARKAAIAREMAAKCEAARAAYRKARTVEMTKRGVAAPAIERGLAGAIDRQELEGDFPIHLDDGRVVDVRAILADPKAFHRKTCADPLEPDYGGGRNKAVILSASLPARIYSHAHGGIDYALVLAVTDYFQPVEPDAGEDNWPEPLDVFGDGEADALADLPAGALPDVLERYSHDVAERMGASVAFVAAGALAVVSGVLGSARIQPKERDTGWKEAPFFWVVTVAPPGAKKSPAIAEVVAPLRRLEFERIEQDGRKLAAWEEANRRGKKVKEGEAAQPIGPKPRLRRSIVENATIEALAGILADNPKGVLWIADEWAGMVCGFGQYKQGGGSDRAEVLKLMNGGPNVFDRASSGVRSVRCWGASILGAVQPDRLAEMMQKNGMAADGLVQRFAFIVGDNLRRPGVDRAPDHTAGVAYSDLIIGLAQLPAEFPAVVTLAPEAQAARREFEAQLERLKDLPDLSEAWAGHLNKWPGIFARILLLFHVAERWADEKGAALAKPVDGATAAKALRFSRYLLRHAMRVYEEFIGLGETAEHARKAAGAILMLSDADTITRHTIYDKVRKWEPQGGRPHPELMAAMRALERLNWCRTEKTDDRGSSVWRVNPKIFGRFKDRSMAEAERRAESRRRIAEAVMERRRLRREDAE